MACMVAFQRLDLDHFGAEIGEHQPAARSHDHMNELNNTYALEGQPAFSHSVLRLKRSFSFRGKAGVSAARFYSALIPAALMTAVQRSISSRTSLFACAGVLPTVSTPSSVKRFFDSTPFSTAPRA